jgi:hypothetical protein
MGKRPGGTPGKKPPAPSARKRPAGDLQAQIAREFYTVLERLRADPELLAVVGSWRDTLTDAEVLSMLQEYASRVWYRRRAALLPPPHSSRTDATLTFMGPLRVKRARRSNLARPGVGRARQT